MSTKLYIFTSARDAVLNSCNHGWSPIDVETASWPEELRLLLADSVMEAVGARYAVESDIRPSNFGGNICGYSVAPPTEDGLKAHLRARLVKMAEEKAEAQRKAEEIIAQEDADFEVVRAEVERLKALPIEELNKIVNCNGGIDAYDFDGFRATGRQRIHNAVRRFTKSSIAERYLNIKDLGREEELAEFWARNDVVLIQEKIDSLCELSPETLEKMSSKAEDGVRHVHISLDISWNRSVAALHTLGYETFDGPYISLDVLKELAEDLSERDSGLPGEDDVDPDEKTMAD